MTYFCGLVESETWMIRNSQYRDSDAARQNDGKGCVMRPLELEMEIHLQKRMARGQLCAPGLLLLSNSILPVCAKLK